MHMQSRTRALKFTAVLSFVVLSLTGFSTGRHHSRHGGAGGGGCSSSHQDHDSSSSSTSGGGSYDDSDEASYGSSGTSGSTGGGYHYTRRPTHRATSTPSGGGSKPLRDGTAKLISCATEKKPYATVEVTNPNDRKGTFSVDVSFRDGSDAEADYGYTYVTVPAKGRATVRVKPDSGNADLIDHCRVEPEADAD
ncbi:hypothetical protein [Streptomyces sp. NPDC007905]|uniref:hypothetical protein n=1 Tax=Streptomyces sp. NPDC007905 TaxID=3364788 RepID=UPI0036EB55B0